jgi:hypothetical protein
MKNLHLLPTPNPSRLFISNTDKVLELDTECIISEDWWIKNQNIYITNDEEIKEGDWCYYLNNLGGGNIVCQAYKHSEDKRMLFDNGNHNRKIGEGITPLMGECKKIILTTDQDLIKDGVQAIDDEFLEWFVKNPSCEEIKIIDEIIEDTSKDYIVGLGQPCTTVYKIIIPKEEPKQETLEEAYNKIYKEIDFSEFDFASFAIGVKYQQEKSYSKEEVKKLAFDFYYDMSHKMGVAENLISENATNVDIWFIEQFKNK